MPTPSRVDSPEELTDVALGCHTIGHIWWVTHEKEAGISIGKTIQFRRYFACLRGCGCTKTFLGGRHEKEGWGKSYKAGDKYGINGGWNKDDFWDEVKRRELADPDWQIPGPEFGFEFDDDEYEIVVVRKPRRKRRTG